MLRNSSVHHQERFVQAVFADLVCGNTRTTRHVQPLQSSSYNFVGNHLPQLCPKVVKHPVYFKMIYGPYNVKLC